MAVLWNGAWCAMSHLSRRQRQLPPQVATARVAAATAAPAAAASYSPMCLQPCVMTSTCKKAAFPSSPQYSWGTQPSAARSWAPPEFEQAVLDPNKAPHAWPAPKRIYYESPTDVDQCTITIEYTPKNFSPTYLFNCILKICHNLVIKSISRGRTKNIVGLPKCHINVVNFTSALAYYAELPVSLSIAHQFSGALLSNITIFPSWRILLTYSISSFGAIPDTMKRYLSTILRFCGQQTQRADQSSSTSLGCSSPNWAKNINWLIICIHYTWYYIITFISTYLNAPHPSILIFIVNCLPLKPITVH